MSFNKFFSGNFNPILLLLTILLIVFISLYQLSVHVYDIHPFHRRRGTQTSICSSCRFKNVEAFDTKTTCSVEADQRGPNQKVLAFSLYGQIGDSDNMYLKGIETNLKLAEEYYPGYVVRLYTDAVDQNSTHYLCQLYCQYPQLDICNVYDIAPYGNISKSFGMIWRFSPMADPLVSEWHSRDLDSRLSKREKEVVMDWKENFNKTYHIMRDHPWHNVPIMGGMFGMRFINESARKVAKEMFEEILEKSLDAWTKGVDQNLLAKILWPKIGSDLVQYDSFQCEHYTVSTKPFISQRNATTDFKNGSMYNFVGANPNFSTLSLSVGATSGCPPACRPRDHQDWLLC